MNLQHKEKYRDLQATVVGCGASGRAAALVLAKLGATVQMLEQKPEGIADTVQKELLKAGVIFTFGPHKPEHFTNSQLVVLSPGVQPRKIKALLQNTAQPVVMSELELGWLHAKGKTLAITGTNGKTTSTALAGHILKKAGFSVFTGGNIGTPLCTYVLDERKSDILVLEVSSFQAAVCMAFRPDVGIFLNFGENHLDYHKDMAEYLQAKLNLFTRMRSQDLAVFPQTMQETLKSMDIGQAKKYWFLGTERFHCPTLPGKHNQENMEAVFQGLTHFGVDEHVMQKALADFRPHPHRLESLGKVKGVEFVNDSKATTVDALKAALTSFTRPVLLLAGGAYKGGDLAALIPVLKKHVRCVCLFGKSREIFEKAWKGSIELFWQPTLEKAVKTLFVRAEPKDIILLSPASASFDSYTDYKARGLDFKRIYKELNS